MALSSDNIRLVFWIAVVPALASLGIMIFGVREPPQHHAEGKERLRLSDAGLMPVAFWMATGIAIIFTFARFSEAFLILRAQHTGLPLAFVPSVMVVMNIVYAGSAYPAGVLSDRIGRTGLLAIGIACLIGADLILAFGTTVAGVMLGVLFWGLHMGLTQGLFASLVADTAPARLRGTGFGIFSFAQGISMLVASVVAGGLWDGYGPKLTFVAGSCFAAIALIALLLWRWRIGKNAVGSM